MREEQRQIALHTLKEAIDLTALKSKDRPLIQRKGNTVTVGRFRVVKVDEFMNIYEGKKLLYSEVKLIETAIAIIECLLRKRTNKIGALLTEDKNYSKHYIDMKYYSRSMREGPPENRCIFQDRYLVSKDKARSIRQKVEQLRFQL